MRELNRMTGLRGIATSSFQNIDEMICQQPDGDTAHGHCVARYDNGPTHERCARSPVMINEYVLGEKADEFVQ